MSPPQIITLTTDFGQTDSYVAAMKGVILGIAPDARVVDVTHEISPQNLHQAAFVLQGIRPYYPPATIHVVVVDPGVGSERRPIAVRTDDGTFVGPDNGVFSFLFPEGDRSPGTGPVVIHLDQPAYWLPDVSQTFHGRDIFAPVAAHLATGVAFAALGSLIANPIRLLALRPEHRADGTIRGHIVHRDHFGNLISNVPAQWLAGRRWAFHLAGQEIAGPSPTYAAVPPGRLVALIGSSGHLEVAVRDGSAAARLAVDPGEPIEAHPLGA